MKETNDWTNKKRRSLKKEGKKQNAKWIHLLVDIIELKKTVNT